MISEEALEDLDLNIRNVKRRGWMPGTGWNRI